MPTTIPDNSRARHVVLVDAVVWSSAYPADDPRREVRSWFARWLEGYPGVRVTRMAAEDDLLGAVASGVDGVIVSGSPRDAWAADPVNERLCQLVLHCRERALPFLGVCYGHQILGRALGASVARHPGGLELGNTPVELTAAGRSCELFAGFPPSFEVLSSHADAVLNLPDGAELLVRGAFTEIQGFRCGPSLYGVQFHPEMDPEILRFLWSTRRELWRPRVSFDLDQVLEELRPAPQAVGVLGNFVTRVIA
ncbi:MAG: type 1 glutamine amidotransferase [Verrucomicrobia bacterium]|nr:type 1 glutamine amidotransferase [Verrucomicrobiota bacterium]